jgi:hypothetical protein
VVTDQTEGEYFAGVAGDRFLLFVPYTIPKTGYDSTTSECTEKLRPRIWQVEPHLPRAVVTVLVFSGTAQKNRLEFFQAHDALKLNGREIIHQFQLDSKIE